ncbi:MAG: hypothetical protein KGN84_20240 [Acidobacteriota bacterium]|nr:hypothetical protein [Acidobacteriota bacterium]
MSYLDQMERLLNEHEARVGAKTVHSIEFVRVGSFQIKVTVTEPLPPCSATFELKGGFTPGTQRAIKEWYEPILMRGRVPEPKPASSPEAAELPVSPEDPPEPKPAQRVKSARGFVGSLRRLVPNQRPA